jgi:CubicO group peptidase (beta-lactamase class C family)
MEQNNMIGSHKFVGILYKILNIYIMKQQILKLRIPFLFIVFCFINPCIGQINTVSGKTISIATMDQFLKIQMDSLELPGLSIAIINDGKIIYHRALGVSNVNTIEKADFCHIPLSGPNFNINEQVDEFSIFEAGSLSKPLFAYFVIKMVDKGLLSLDTPLYKYLPYPDIAYDERYKLITARMVLCHTSGFPNWRCWNAPDPSLHLKKNELYIKFTPGTDFSYSGEGYEYLAMVIAYLNHGSLRTLDSLFQKEVAVPLGIPHAYYSWNDYLYRHKVNGQFNDKPSGKGWPLAYMAGIDYAEEHSMDSSCFGSAYSLHTEAASYAKFLIVMMEGRGFKKESFDEMLKAQVQLSKQSDFCINRGDTAWGLGIAIEPTMYGTRYKHDGDMFSFQSAFMFFKEQKNGYVFFTNCNKGMNLNEKLEYFLTEGKLK